MAHAYVVTNALAGLATSKFSFSASVVADISFLNDGRMDRRSTGGFSVGTGYNVVIDLGTATALAGFALLNSNFTAQQAVSMKVEGADNAGISVNNVVAKAATLLNSAAPKSKDHVLQFATVTKRYWRLTWSWSGGGNLLLPSIGEIFAYAPTAVTQLLRKVIYGWGETEELKVATVSFDRGDSQSLFLGGPIRSKNIRMADLATAERDQMLAMWRATQGPVTPLLWIESYEATATAAAVAEQDCIYGFNTQVAAHWVEGDFALYQPDDFIIQSLGREAGS